MQIALHAAIYSTFCHCHCICRRDLLHLHCTAAVICIYCNIAFAAFIYLLPLQHCRRRCNAIAINSSILSLSLPLFVLHYCRQLAIALQQQHYFIALHCTHCICSIKLISYCIAAIAALPFKFCIIVYCNCNLLHNCTICQHCTVLFALHIYDCRRLHFAVLAIIQRLHLLSFLHLLHLSPFAQLPPLLSLHLALFAAVLPPRLRICICRAALQLIIKHLFIAIYLLLLLSFICIYLFIALFIYCRIAFAAAPHCTIALYCYCCRRICRHRFALLLSHLLPADAADCISFCRLRRLAFAYCCC